METTDLRELTRRIRDFAEARDWEQFHTPKNLVMALSVEVGELAEHFQWLTPEEVERLAGDPDAHPDLAGEVADVAIHLLRLADVLDLDVAEAVRDKLEANERRFPAERVRGRATLPPSERPLSMDARSGSPARHGPPHPRGRRAGA